MLFAPCIREVNVQDSAEKLDHLFYLNVFSSDQPRHIMYCTPQYKIGDLIKMYHSVGYKNFVKPARHRHIFTTDDFRNLCAKLGINNVSTYF